MNKFGGYIGDIRRERRITLRNLAQMVGVSPGYLSEIENGRKVPPRDEKTIGGIADSLGIDREKLRKLALKERALGKVQDFLSTLMGGDGDLAYSLYRAADGKPEAKLHELKERLRKTIHEWEKEETDD